MPALDHQQRKAGRTLSNGACFLTGESTGRRNTETDDYRIWNLATDSEPLQFKAPRNNTVPADRLIISADGKSFLGRYAKEGKSSARGHKINYVYKINSWAEMQGKSLAHVASSVLFPGEILTYTLNFNRFIVYEDSASPSSMSTALCPLFSIVDVIADSNGIKTSIRPLLDWDDQLKKIQNMSAAIGTGININGLSGQMTPDGQYFSLDVTLTTEIKERAHTGYTRVTKFEQDWVGIWNLEQAQRIGSISSLDLDTPDDLEPHPGARSRGAASEIVWKRKLKTRLLSDGRLAIARAVAHYRAKDLWEVVMKAVILDPSLSTLEDRPISLRLGPLTFNYPETDSHWRGITHLEISPDGNYYGLRFTQEGLKVFNLSRFLNKTRSL